MDVIISQGHYPPANPSGITVVIDVIRAFTTAHYAFDGGVSRIHLVATAPEALKLKSAQPDLLLSGEIDALPIAGFDFGNSPWEIEQASLAGRELVQRTTNGVAATLRARDSAEVLVAGLINAEATARYILNQCSLKQHPQKVSLIASHPTGDEDVACAQYIRTLLLDSSNDGTDNAVTLEQASARTLNAYAAGKFFDGTHPRLRGEDIVMAANSAGDHGRVMIVNYSPSPIITSL
jgi:2-phosphosulfolactate phosphatase|tara:strand:+ start:73762 stop:74469 length:708 start_codon:yes stop_codon:yes gene_type:complete